jgi:hypothetical protein
MQLVTVDVCASDVPHARIAGAARMIAKARIAASPGCVTPKNHSTPPMQPHQIAIKSKT